ncbi:putative P-loop ATPase [uncultured Desulfobacterium sp.]|uniref:Putative P-loop ATPase n=1 Tax=uncultured Desulfobacterium sp. TaxID=201089 RepID=A0A445N055_9BACT|nr:putative P-loop ATPase [uncultured Desulfobacterium sp.]
MWPDHETAIDLLGIKHLKDAVLDIIKDSKLHPATIGIFGDWGSGKSSLIKMVTEELNNDSAALVIEFNGWLFESYDDAKSALMETVVDELVRKTPTDKSGEVKKLAVRLLRKINWFRLGGKAIQYGVTAAATGGIGVLTAALTDLPSLAKKAGQLLEEIDPTKAEEIFKEETKLSISRNIRAFRSEFQTVLEKSGFSTVVITIDDLDRCLPSTIIETLEAIRLFLYVPKTAFILGADERLVKYAVRSRFPELPGDRTDVGRDYLEKLVQYTVRIPPMTRADTENYIALLLTQGKIEQSDYNKCIQWALNSDSIQEGRTFTATDASGLFGQLSDDLREDLALSQRIGTVLGMGLNGNPRQCKRFLNTLIMRIKMADYRGIKLERRILAKLMLLEYFRPQFFRSLAEWQSMQSGISKQLKIMEQSLPFQQNNESEKDPSAKVVDLKEKEKLPEIDAWLQDQWVLQWAETEPSLAEIDLRPYYYFSREKLTDLSGSAKRLSPEAQNIIRKLFSKSEAVRGNAFRQATSLNQADAAAVLDELFEKSRNSENNSDENSSLGLAVNWVFERNELGAELIAFINALPDSDLPIWVVTRLEKALKDSPHKSALLKLLERISNSLTASKALKTAAKSRFDKIVKGGK